MELQNLATGKIPNLVGEAGLPKSLMTFMKRASPWWLTMAVRGDHSREMLIKWLKMKELDLDK